MFNQKRLCSFFILSLFFLGGLFSSAGCTNSTPGLAPTLSPEDQVGKIFWPFYLQVGPEHLGKPISPVFEYDNLKYQYFEGGLLIYDQYGKNGQKYRLGSLGVELGFSGPPSLDPGPDGDGYTVDPLFLSLYQALGKEKIVGKPLTNSYSAKATDNSTTIVQYFSNLGFYWIEGTPRSDIRLIQYGVLKCLDPDIRNTGLPCTTTLAELALDLDHPSSINDQDIPEPYATSLSRLGNLFPGGKIGMLALGGKEVLVLERAAFYTDPTSGVGRAFAYPMASELNILRDVPVQQSKDDPLGQLIFIAVAGQLGYHVPEYFYYFIVQNGGFDIFGQPISQVHSLKNGLYRQCFENLCLDFFPELPENQKLQLAPIGQEFFDHHTAHIKIQTPDQLPTYKISLFHKEYLNENQNQEFSVQVTHPTAPVDGLKLSLYLMIPGQDVRVFPFEPTSRTGITTLSLPYDQQLAMVHGVNGLIVPYKVCINTSEPQICESDGYLVWTGK